MFRKLRSTLHVCNTRKKRGEEERAIQRALEILDMMHLADMRYELAANLPYGRQRMLEIARALASEPKLLLLDEPAAGMNEQETEELLGIIALLNQMQYSVLLIVGVDEAGGEPMVHVIVGHEQGVDAAEAQIVRQSVVVGIRPR